TGTESGNAETAKPSPKVKRACALLDPPFTEEKVGKRGKSG
ncbi:unnamed protein product, partial [marine sediment metagenome]